MGIFSRSPTRFAAIMISLAILSISLLAVGAQVRPIIPRLDRLIKNDWQMRRPVNPPRPNAVIENKNVNIIVNVDPKDVAKELWKIIQNRMVGKHGHKSLNERQTVEELERIVTPVVMPTRRSHKPSAFEIAYSLDHITRKALLNDHLEHPTINDEIVTRDIVARMMLTLQKLTDKDDTETKSHNEPELRRMQETEEEKSENNNNNNKDDFENQYVSVNVKIRRSDLLKSTVSSVDNDS